MFKKLLLFAWVVLIGATLSCKGPAGDVGPQGAKGDTGATGATGATGPAGKDGTGGDGSVAVGYTHGADTTDADGYFYSGFSFDSEAAAAAAVKNSVVLVYIKAQGVYWPLPGVVIFGDKKVSQFTFVHYVDKANFLIDIVQTGWSEDQDAAPVRIAQDIKVVFIPAADMDGRSNAELSKMSYEEVMTTLGLTEKDVKTLTRRRK